MKNAACAATARRATRTALSRIGSDREQQQNYNSVLSQSDERKEEMPLQHTFCESEWCKFTQPFKAITRADITPYLCMATRVSLSLPKDAQGKKMKPPFSAKFCENIAQTKGFVVSFPRSCKCRITFVSSCQANGGKLGQSWCCATFSSLSFSRALFSNICLVQKKRTRRALFPLNWGRSYKKCC